jgi:hypothetical protein
MQTTQLAHGKITNADALIIELREPDNEPATVLIHWPRRRPWRPLRSFRLLLARSPQSSPAPP